MPKSHTKNNILIDGGCALQPTGSIFKGHTHRVVFTITSVSDSLSMEFQNKTADFPHGMLLPSVKAEYPVGCKKGIPAMPVIPC